MKRLTTLFALVVCLGASVAAAQNTNAQDIVLYASDIPSNGLHGSWTTQSDGTAAGGTQLATPDVGFSTTSGALAAPNDYVDVTFDAPANVAYHVWLRLRATADSKWNDSVWLQFSDALAGGSPAYAIGSTDGLPVNLENCSGCGVSGWGWQDRAWWLSQNPVVSFARSGTHTLRIQVREDGVQFDQIVLSPSRYISTSPGAVQRDSTIVAKSSSTPPPTPTPPPPPTDGNIALGRPAVASSVENTAYVPGKAVDGDSTTRWSSQFSDPQWISVDLGQTMNVDRINLRWETAYASAYDIQVSTDAQSWQTIYTQNSGAGGAESLSGLSGVGRYLRVFGRQRATPWGYSLFELQVFGTPVSSTAPNLARNRPATASSIEAAGYAAGNAVDQDTSTRWSSQFSDPQWLSIDLGATTQVNRVLLRWETAYGSAYQIQVSDDAQSWTTIFATSAGDGGIDDLTGLSGAGRYVRMLATRRATPWGYSLWEMEVYGTATATPPPPPPPPPSGNTPPDVQLVAPVNGDRHSDPANVWLAANASDADGIARVDFYADGQLIGTDTTVPYQILWQGAPRGAHQVFAVATDRAGMQGTSEVVNLGVTPFAALNVARSRPAWASSVAGGDTAGSALDGSTSTAWTSAAGGTQWLSLDLGGTIGVDRFVLRWAPGAHASSYQIVFSTKPDFSDGGPVQGTVITSGSGGVETIQLTGVPYVRYVRIVATAGLSPSGYSLEEFEIYRTLQLTPPSTPTISGAANGSTGNRRDPALDWSAPYATANDVYFGTSNPPPLFAANLLMPSYRMFSLAADTLYYWQVVARNEAGTTAGSVWSFQTGSATPSPSPNVALSRRATAASESASGPASAAVDGSYSTHWTSAGSDPQWISVDLATGYTIDRVVVGWDAAYASKYDVQVSPDGLAWTTVFSNEAGAGGVEVIPLRGIPARLVRVVGRQRGTAAGYSLNEIEVYGR
jgi:hypothetical protein